MQGGAIVPRAVSPDTTRARRTRQHRPAPIHLHLQSQSEIV